MMKCNRRCLRNELVNMNWLRVLFLAALIAMSVPVAASVSNVVSPSVQTDCAECCDPASENCLFDASACKRICAAATVPEGLEIRPSQMRRIAVAAVVKTLSPLTLKPDFPPPRCDAPV